MSRFNFFALLLLWGGSHGVPPGGAELPSSSRPGLPRKSTSTEPIAPSEDVAFVSRHATEDAQQVESLPATSQQGEPSGEEGNPTGPSSGAAASANPPAVIASASASADFAGFAPVPARRLPAPYRAQVQVVDLESSDEDSNPDLAGSIPGPAAAPTEYLDLGSSDEESNSGPADPPVLVDAAAAVAIESGSTEPNLGPLESISLVEAAPATVGSVLADPNPDFTDPGAAAMAPASAVVPQVAGVAGPSCVMWVDTSVSSPSQYSNSSWDATLPHPLLGTVPPDSSLSGLLPDPDEFGEMCAASLLFDDLEGLEPDRADLKASAQPGGKKHSPPSRGSCGSAHPRARKALRYNYRPDTPRVHSPSAGSSSTGASEPFLHYPDGSPLASDAPAAAPSTPIPVPVAPALSVLVTHLLSLNALLSCLTSTFGADPDLDTPVHQCVYMLRQLIQGLSAILALVASRPSPP